MSKANDLDAFKNQGDVIWNIANLLHGPYRPPQYRQEIEDCLMKHPAVSIVAVVGSPDKERTEVVKAFIIPKTGVTLGPEIEEDIKNFVIVRLAAHEYPQKVEFVTELPMTTTGKIKRRELKQLEIDANIRDIQDEGDSK